MKVLKPSENVVKIMKRTEILILDSTSFCERLLLLYVCLASTSIIRTLFAPSLILKRNFLTKKSEADNKANLNPR